MQRRSPMSHSKFNGSRNVLTLPSVKMTERDMRQRSHWGPPRHYYHSVGSSEKLTACITNRRPNGRITLHMIFLMLIIIRAESFYQWIFGRSLSLNELRLLRSSPWSCTLWVLSHNTAAQLVPLSQLWNAALQRCALCLDSPRLFRDGRAIFLHGKQHTCIGLTLQRARFYHWAALPSTVRLFLHSLQKYTQIQD